MLRNRFAFRVGQVVPSHLICCRARHSVGPIPNDGTAAGGLFLWTLDGRPQVAMCVYPSTPTTFDHEFQSLSLFPLAASVDDESIWEPLEAGIEFLPLGNRLGTKLPHHSLDDFLDRLGGQHERFVQLGDFGDQRIDFTLRSCDGFTLLVRKRHATGTEIPATRASPCAKAFGEFSQAKSWRRTAAAIDTAIASLRRCCPPRTLRWIARVSSGTTPLVAFVPPSAPAISIGASDASHPVKKLKSSRIGRIAAIIRSMLGRSPRAVFDADDPRAFRGQSNHRGHVDRRSEQRNVVERDIDRDVIGDLAKVRVDPFAAEPVVERRDDGDGTNAHRAVRLHRRRSFP